MTYGERVDEISGPVLALQASVSSGIENVISGEAGVEVRSSNVLALNRDARQLSDDAQAAVFRLSGLGPPYDCREFHRKHSEALHLYSQMGFEYALATSQAVEDAANPVNLDILARGDMYRADANAAMSEAEALRAECEG
jgi:hypothetical protein